MDFCIASGPSNFSNSLTPRNQIDHLKLSIWEFKAFRDYLSDQGAFHVSITVWVPGSGVMVFVSTDPAASIIMMVMMMSKTIGVYSANTRPLAFMSSQQLHKRTWKDLANAYPWLTNTWPANVQWLVSQSRYNCSSVRILNKLERFVKNKKTIFDFEMV